MPEEMRLSRLEIVERFKERWPRIEVMALARFDQYAKEARIGGQVTQAEAFARFAADYLRSLLDVVFDE
jgi:hypothetical protein